MFADEDGRNESPKDTEAQENNNRVWAVNSPEYMDDGSSEGDTGRERRFLIENGQNKLLYSEKKRAKYNRMSWNSSENVPSIFNECTLMSEDDLKKEMLGEESGGDGTGSSPNCCYDVQRSAIKMNKTVTGPEKFNKTPVVDELIVKEEPMSEEEVEEEVVADYNLGKEEVILCDMTQECTPVEEEVVIEDGHFPAPHEEGSIVDMPLSKTLSDVQYVNEGSVGELRSRGNLEKFQAPKLNVEKAVNNLGDKSSLLVTKPSTIKLPSLEVHSELKPSAIPTISSNSNKGPAKGMSLLKKSIIIPGKSRLLSLPAVPSAARTNQQSNHLTFKSLSQKGSRPDITPAIKSSADAKGAIFAQNYSKLKTRVHEEQEAATSHLLKALPIITSLACDPAYKALHHYAANSLDEFFNWPLPKQRASEWIRACEVRKLLSAQGFSVKEEENAWTTKDIMMWARLRGPPLSPKVPLAPLHFTSSEVLDLL